MVLVTAGTGLCFLLDGQCVAPSPCRCSGSYVYCQNTNLGTIPTFLTSTINDSYIYFYVQGNEITTVKSYTFRNITFANTTSVRLYFQNNKLNSIEYQAFAGVEENVRILNLENNMFTSVPAELAKLTNLETLQLTGNPIQSLAPSANVFANLGRHLQSFYIDLGQFDSWPTELRYLKSLAGLYLTNIKETNLDYDAFRGFENNLNTLSMRYTKLTKLPVAVCHLQNLQTLYFTDNANLHWNSTIIEPCSSDLTTLTQLYLRNNSIRYLPRSIFETFPSLQNLYLDNNQLTFIDSDVVTAYLPLQILSLNYNNFTRIPTAVRQFRSLRYLYLQNNRITTVEMVDLDGLSQLNTLYLDNNPIEYISATAFVDNKQLRNLQLQNTKLRYIPPSLVNLPRLYYVYLSGSPIECSCTMTYLNTWDVTTMAIYGNCEKTSISIETYISVDLPQC